MKTKYLLTLSLLLSLPVEALASEVVWRVEAGFAPFGKLANPDEVSRAWLPPRRDGQIVDFDTWYRQLYAAGRLTSSPYNEWLQPNAKTKSPWNANEGRHDFDYVNPNSVNLRAKLTGHSGTCVWHIKRQGRLLAESRREGNCSDFTRIENARLVGDQLVAAAGVTTLTVPIVIEHLVVVGLGDSYASGEGNPDKPSLWKRQQAPIDTFAWLEPEKKGGLLESDAKWLDTDCHRSFFNYQTFTALRLAAENPHRLVTYLHYACSGAEIFDGLIAPQSKPPGMTDSCRRPIHQRGSKRVTWDERPCFLPKSQIASMMTDLCSESGEIRPAAEVKRRIEADVEQQRSLLRLENYKKGPRIDALTCTNPRQPDLVLMSIGGNDSGFAQLLSWAILPHETRASVVPANRELFSWIRSRSVVCPALGRAKGERCDVLDYELIRQLPVRFLALRHALDAVLPCVQRKVVLNSYPVAVTKSGPTGMSWCFDDAGCNPLNGWDGARASLPSVFGIRSSGSRCDRPNRGWHFNIRESEVDALVFKSTSAGQATVPMLRNALQQQSDRLGFNFAQATSSALDGQGFCREDVGDMPIALPSRAPHLWRCSRDSRIFGNPECWDPYRPAGRFIRTINDSLMTMSSGRQDGLSGTFHPTAQGHAALAEKAWPTVESVIRRSRGLDNQVTSE